ncbi:14828_t:CDS:2 [Dentiscutata erythropus]|uniref:14828_t:CDS:1 n=1 Tax=Dentiscutata erythropus TaxID=1348616 RepID=A0A9N9CK72_9GLOM|nr:14828_t:CDS:2 [Dentiscutata erythropus]
MDPNVVLSTSMKPIFDAIKELLSNPEIFKYCTFNYTPRLITNDKGELKHCYREQYGGVGLKH